MFYCKSRHFVSAIARPCSRPRRVWRQTLSARHLPLWNVLSFVRLELRNAGSLMCCSGLQQFLYQSGWNIAPLQSCEQVWRCEMRAHLSNGGRKYRDFGARKRYLCGMPFNFLPWQWPLRCTVSYLLTKNCRKRRVNFRRTRTLTFNERTEEPWKVPLNSSFCAVTADSNPRRPHGRKAYFRSGFTYQRAQLHPRNRILQTFFTSKSKKEKPRKVPDMLHQNHQSVKQ